MATHTTASQIQDIGVVVAGAKKHAKELPASAAKVATELAKLHAELQADNIAQEQIKASLKAKTVQIKSKLKAARAGRLRILQLAQGTFGANGAELGDFRVKGEG